LPSTVDEDAMMRNMAEEMRDMRLGMADGSDDEFDIE